MPETRAYKLNEQRQPGSRPGTLIYHYYGPDGRLHVAGSLGRTL